MRASREQFEDNDEGLSWAGRIALAAVFASLAALALVPAIASAATELTPSSDPLPGSTFQAGDGNQSPISGDLTREDWGSLDLGPLIKHTVDPSNPDSAFAGGSKENNPDGWDFAYPAESTPLKANFRVIWSILGGGSDQFLYLAFRRADNGGNTYLAFELNQQSKLWTNSAGATIPCRTTGDLIVTYNVQNNDATKIFLRAEKWTTATADPATGCARTGSLSNITSLVDGVNVQGAVNNESSPTLPGEIPSPRPQAGAIPSLLESSPSCNSTTGWICTGLFGEAGLNLTGVFEEYTGKPCFSFGSFWAHGRSSESSDSAMQDYVGPDPAKVQSCTVSGSKWEDLNGNGVWDKPSEPAVAGWKVWLDLNDDGKVDAPGEIATTDSNGAYEFKDVPAGEYTVRELAAADQDGDYRQSLTTCTFPKVDCDQGYTVELTKDETNSTGNDFGNYAKPKLQLRKAIDPSADPGKFDLLADSVPTGGDQVKALGVGNGGSSAVTAVKAGQYALSESASAGTDPANYVFGSVKCFNRSDDSVFPVSSDKITLSSGKDVYCSWTNTRKTNITITKATDPSSATDKFSFSGPGDPPASFELANGESKPFSDLTPGDEYAFSETVPSGWTLSSIKCTGTDPGNVKTDGPKVTVTPDAGEDVTCTYSNTKLAKVTIAKATDPTSATDKFSFSGPGDPPASFQLANGESKPFSDLAPGQGYSWSEKVPSGWTLAGIKCTGTNPGNVKVDASTVTVTPDAGEDVTCTYSNTKLAKVTIAKTTDPTSATDKFSFSGPGDPPASFQLANGESKPFVDLAPGQGYSWSEKVPSGWTLTGIKCVGTDPENVKTDGSTVTVTPDAGEDVTCTYSNTKLAKVTIAKTTDPTSATDKFSFSGPGDPPASFQLANGESKPFVDLAPGQGYSWSEKVPTGWTLAGIKCTGTDPGNVKVDASTVTVTPDAGEDVTCTYSNTKLAKVTIAKSTDPSSATDKFSFSGPGDPPASFQLANGESKPFTDLAPGQGYSWSEKVPSGWTLTGIKCSGTDPENVKVDASTVTVTPDAGEDVTCTYTNTKLAKVTIAKATHPSSATDKFSFSGPGDPPASFQLANGESKPFADLAPGQGYSWSEKVPSGWALTGIKCTGTDTGNVKVDGSAVTVTPQSGEDVTCTYSNTKLAKVTIAKSTDPSSATDKFSFSGPGDPPVSFQLANGESKPFVDLAPGQGYSWSEKVPSGWTLTGIKCSGTDPENVKVDASTVTVTPDAGEDVTCTYTNTKLAKVTIAKATDPSSATDKFSFSGPGDPPASFQLTNGESKPFVDLAPGQGYSWSEKVPTGWTLTGIKCSGTDPGNVKVDGSSVTVTPDAGEDVTCTYTNTKLAKVTIAKATDPSSATDKFSFSGPGDPPASFELANGESKPFVDLAPGQGYSWSEKVPTGWTLAGIKCTGTDPGNVKVDASTVTVTPDAGEDVTCTYSNTKLAKVTIAKATDPTSAKDKFSFSGPGDPPASFELANGESKPFVDLAPGQGYSWSEKVPSGWTLTGIKCVGTDPENVKTDGSTVTVAPDAGEEVTCTYSNTKLAKVTIAKATDPTSATDKFSFSGPGDPPASFELANGESKPFVDLAPGQGYSWSEKVPSGWTLTGIRCSGTDPENVKVDGSTVTVTPDAGEDVTCTYSNTKLAKVTIAKATDPSSATDKFSFSGPGDPPASFQLANGESKPFVDLAPGQGYSWSEKVPSGWTLTGIKCVGTDPENVKTDGSTVTVAPDAGEDVTCTYSNTKLARVTIAKATDPTSATDKFTFSGPGDPPASFELANGESKPFGDLAPGQGYSWSEKVPSGWTLTGIKCSGTDPANVRVDGSIVTVTPGAGEDVTCTYTNTKLAKVTIVKATDPSSATDKFSFSGPGDPPASFELANGESKPFADLAPGQGYSWSEKVPSGWTLTGIKCIGTDPANVKTDGSTVTVTPQSGEDVTCTYTNTKLAKVTITKATDPAAAPDKFDFTGPGDPPATFQLADGEAKPFADLAPGVGYPFSEKAPAGWSVTSIKCSGTDPANVKTDLPTGSVTVTPQAGEEVNCTYSNTQKRGSIAGFKFNDLNGNGVWDKPQEPALEGWKVGLDKDSSGTIDPGEPVAATDSTGAYSFADLLFGSYTVLELPAADQATPDLQAFKVCSLPKTDCAKGYSVTLNVEAPDATDRTFGNYVAPKLELRKAVDPTTDTGTFNLLADGGNGGDQVKAESVGNGGTSGAGGTAVKPGAYALSESVATGTLTDDYVLGTAACINRSDQSPVELSEGSLTLTGGQDVVCSWTNTRKAKLELRKQVGPASDTGKFDLFANSVPAGPDPVVSAINVGNGSTFSPTSVEPGTYALSEAAHVGTPGGDYTFGDPECFNRADDSPVTVTGGQVKLSAGQDVYCSWLNIRTQAFIKGNARIGGTTGCARGRYAYARIFGSPISRVTWYVNHKRYTSQVKRNAGRYFQLKLRVAKLRRSYYAITAVVNYSPAAIAPRTVKRKLAFRICRPLRSTG